MTTTNNKHLFRLTLKRTEEQPASFSSFTILLCPQPHYHAVFPFASILSDKFCIMGNPNVIRSISFYLLSPGNELNKERQRLWQNKLRWRGFNDNNSRNYHRDKIYTSCHNVQRLQNPVSLVRNGMNSNVVFDLLVNLNTGRFSVVCVQTRMFYFTANVIITACKGIYFRWLFLL